MNDLLKVYELLNQSIRQDDVLCLAQSVAWLDPFCFIPVELEFYEDEAGILQNTLLVTRDFLPETYAGAINKIRSGANFQVLDAFICESFNDIGIPLNDLQFIPYGIPLPAYGIELDDPEFYENYAETFPLLDCFGIDTKPANPYKIDVPDYTWKVARLIADDLEQRSEHAYQHLAWTLRWLFSITGNSLCDWSHETMCEVEPLAWDETDFALEMIRVADEIMADVWTGLAWFNNEPDVQNNLKNNIQAIYKVLREKGKNNDNPDIRLNWKALTGCTRRAA